MDFFCPWCFHYYNNLVFKFIYFKKYLLCHASFFWAFRQVAKYSEENYETGTPI